MIKKKFFKEITNQDFLMLGDMPSIGNEKLVIDWLKSNYFAANYLKQVLYDYKAFVCSRDNEGNYLWQGSNYGDETVRFDPLKPSSILGRELCRVIVEEEIDRMTPIFHKSPGEKFSYENSDVLSFLMSKRKIFEWLFLVLDINGIILKSHDGKWIGKNNMRSRDE
ncbi:hypothetical protein NE261_09480 [Enterococcus italicus]|uniref:hypothetical protein n=1 Tax=Enterococcus italicus TaxID=246144 RepID=UPI002073A1E1|nr:hypothetical protein [Enterococcus italicus]MCM6932014.1 hypothetical protein [Enterococcus italicus]